MEEKKRKKERLFIFPTTAHLNVYNIRLKRWGGGRLAVKYKFYVKGRED